MSRLSTLPDELFREIFSYIKADVLSGLSPVLYHHSEKEIFQVEVYPERGLRIHKWFRPTLCTIVRVEKYEMGTSKKSVHETRLSLWIWRHRRFLCGYTRPSIEDNMIRHRRLPGHLELQYRFLE